MQKMTKHLLLGQRAEFSRSEQLITIQELWWQFVMFICLFISVN